MAFLANMWRLTFPRVTKVLAEVRTEKSLAHMPLRAPVVQFIDTVLDATEYKDFTQKPMPHVSVGTSHGPAAEDRSDSIDTSQLAAIMWR